MNTATQASTRRSRQVLAWAIDSGDLGVTPIPARVLMIGPMLQ